MSEARRNKRARRGADSESVTVPQRDTVKQVTSTPSRARSLFQGRALWITAALFVINLAIYLPVRHYDFVTFDDDQYVSENPDVAAGLTVQGVRWAFTTDQGANWHPLTWLSHMLDVQMFGLNAGPLHVINLVFHIASTILLFGLFYTMTGALGRSGFVAALFAVHPLHVESVAWISERKDVLSTMLWMLTIWAYVAYVRRPRAARYVTVALLFGLGLMAKPMLVTLPFVLLLLDFWPLERLTLEWSSVMNLVREKLPLFAMAAASSVVTFVVQRRVGAVAGLDAVPVGLRIANAITSYVAYIAKTLWPVNLAVLYPFPKSIPGWQVAGSIAALAAISVAVLRERKRRPYLPVGWLWYLGTLVPVIGLVQAGSQSMADRYTYIPLIGLFIVAAWGVTDLAAPTFTSSTPLMAAALLVLAACVCGSVQQVAYWKDSVALWSRALEATAGNSQAQVALGSLFEKRRNLDEAMTHFSEALRLRPNFAEAHFGLGATLADMGKTAEAVPQFIEAIRLKPDFPEAHNNLGNAAARQGKIDEAIAHYNDALRLKPGDAMAHNGLGAALDRKGKIGEAIAQYNEALRLKPDLAAAHNNMAAALVKQNKFEEAIQQMLEATRIQPNNADFHFNAGMLLKHQARTMEARQQFEAALKINPGHQAARNELSSLEGH